MTFDARRVTRLRRLSVVTLVLLYLLILAGGIVRSTGAGMGCPDWPKCFGEIIPPTSEAELPKDYKAYYSAFRQEKNERFAGLLTYLGYEGIADKILNDPMILVEADFNVYKTWTEYINRLIGAVTGLFILLLFVFALTVWRFDPTIAIVAFATVIITALQGWLGSVVVSTNLLSWLVSLHMFVAFVIIAGVLYINQRVNGRRPAKTANRFPFNGMLIFSIFLLLVQVFFGVEVRETLNEVARVFNYDNRSQWIDAIGSDFYLHRSFSLFVFAFTFFTAWKIRKSPFVDEYANKVGIALIAFLIVEIALGAIMAYFAIPVLAQPLHLVVAVLIFSAQFILLLHFNKNNRLAGGLTK